MYLHMNLHGLSLDWKTGLGEGLPQAHQAGGEQGLEQEEGLVHVFFGKSVLAAFLKEKAFL